MIDFFTNDCKATISETKFWLADNSETIAYFTTDSNDLFKVAEVLNNEAITIDFYAVDKCLEIIDSNNNQVSLCDAMLIANNCLVLIELKDKRDNWIEKSMRQLESTITQFKLAHPDFTITKRIAYAANKMRPEFPYSERERMREFKNRTGFRLLIQATINIPSFSTLKFCF